MLYGSIEYNGQTWEVAIDYGNNATITRGRSSWEGTFCGELLHDFVGRNHVPEQVLVLLVEALS